VIGVHASAYRLRKEARKSWHHTVSDEPVHGFQIVEVARYLPIKISKDYLKGNLSVESHLTFLTERDIHYEECIDWRGCAILFARKQTKNGAQTTQTCMT